MFLAPTGNNHHAFVENRAHFSVPGFLQRGHCSPTSTSSRGSDPKLSELLSTSPMERGATEYSQSGLPSPYPSNFGDTQSEGTSADHASSAQYSIKQEVSYSNQATPTSEYGVYPSSARSSNFSDHIQRPYHPSSAQHPSSSGDPSITATSPPYQYSPFGPHGPGQHVSHHPHPAAYHQEGGGGVIYQHHTRADYSRPEWQAYAQTSPLTPGVGPGVYAAGGPRSSNSQVFNFVALPGSQQHKRPRRRYEEIERMYKCGFQGCEKAYGTLNHLNAHVTMQSHGNKRTPDEFKDIRKEWRLRKKEEEARGKDRQAEEAAAAGHSGGDSHRPGAEDGPVQPGYPVSRGPVLAPIGFTGSQFVAATSAPVPQQPLPEYSPNAVYPNYSPSGPNYPPGASYAQYNHSNGGPQPPSQ